MAKERATKGFWGAAGYREEEKRKIAVGKK
jgi:hypothetical protein